MTGYSEIHKIIALKGMENCKYQVSGYFSAGYGEVFICDKEVRGDTCDGLHQHAREFDHPVVCQQPRHSNRTRAASAAQRI